MTQEIQLEIQKHLSSDEEVIWTGVPDLGGFLLHNIGLHLFLITFFAGIIASCTMSWLNVSFLVAVLPWLIGFIIWHFGALYNEAEKTFYMITTQRILILHDENYHLFESYTADDIEISQIKRINHQFGTIYFAKEYDSKGSAKNIGFIAIPDIEQVAQHIKTLRRTGSPKY